MIKRSANKVSHTVLVASILFVSAGSTSVSRVDPSHYQGGLRNGSGPNRLSAKRLDLVLTSLRHKTGFKEMRFDERGFLRLGDRTNFTEGSATARVLISATAESKRAINLEARDRSMEISFARLAKPTVYRNFVTGAAIDVYLIEMDFSDFSKLYGDKKAIAAFDAGFVILHELGHAVLGLRDDVDQANSPGECEAYINLIRRDLKLPERQSYFAGIRTTALSPTHGSINYAELIFAQTMDKQGVVLPRKFFLRWEAKQVGPILHAYAGQIDHRRTWGTL